MEPLFCPSANRGCFLLVSLSKFSRVHPYVTDRVRYLLRIADRYGGRHTVTSGYRTAFDQQRLFRTIRNVPVAEPGCSQHEYGLAVDVKFSDPRWQNWYLRAARALGLTTVSDDPVHVQAVPGSAFRPIVTRAGLCPDPRFVRYVPRTPKELCLATGESWSCGRFGCSCADPGEFAGWPYY